ncbi:uncharacterized protein LOC143020876 isoform X2 [Oratosquilla oratoria]|uniref:uncharacterized protein LOC143020876 isoform X2 n=1 Tax=Oratosquilla oratoria TaxID=337810 RepID=UPI003F771D38
MMAQKKTAGTLLSGLHVLVILSALVLVTVLVTCLIGHSKMGARLWSDRRGGNRSSNPSSPRHTHHTSLTPANFTHSVSGDAHSSDVNEDAHGGSRCLLLTL